MAPAIILPTSTSEFLKNSKSLRKNNPTIFKKLLKKVKKKNAKVNSHTKPDVLSIPNLQEHVQSLEDRKGIEIEYIPESLDQLEDSKLAVQFKDVIESFYKLAEPPEEVKVEKVVEEQTSFPHINLKEEQHGSDDEEEKPQNGALSKKSIRRLNRPTVANLKQNASRAEVVEVWDTTAADPEFVVWIKCRRNTVPVPGHWSQKRKYMQGKRGIERGPFKLPEYIQATKISEIRSSLQEKESQKTLKQKMREKARPKSHRMDIDYQVLHDAFFKYATKPPLSGFGSLYYEGKENENKMKHFKPGKLSAKLKEALGIGDTAPPPWLINMQKYGPPMSYSNMKIPGLNAPIAPGCEYGYRAGGWGKPPTDIYGNPLYGNYFVNNGETDMQHDEPYWGDIMEEYEAEESDEEESIEPIQEGTTIATEPKPTVDGITSVTSTASSGFVSHLSLDARKLNPPGPSGAKPYTVLPQQESSAQPGALFGSNVTYKMPNMHSDGTLTPLAGVLTPNMGGIVTPLSSGSLTPYDGIGTGSLTPSASSELLRGPAVPGSSGFLSTSEIDSEGTFSGDTIRQQLKHHEAVASRVKKDAGQVDSKEFRKKKEASASGKKKEFKF